jgi:hypothetical protein
MSELLDDLRATSREVLHATVSSHDSRQSSHSGSGGSRTSMSETSACDIICRFALRVLAIKAAKKLVEARFEKRYDKDTGEQ